MKRNFLFILIFFLIGCSVYRIDSADTTLEFYPPKKSADQVQVLDSVSNPFEEIGVVTVTADRARSMDEVLQKIKREAALLGGDAITDLRTESKGVWRRLTQKTFLKNAYIRAQHSAKVIVFK